MATRIRGNSQATAITRDLADGLCRGGSRIVHARGSALAKALADCREDIAKPLLIVAPDPEVAGDIFGDLRFYLGDNGKEPHFWPAWDILPFETEHPDVDIAADQVAVLRACLSNPDDIWLVAPITALVQPTLSRKIVGKGGLSIGAGLEMSPEAVIAHLVEGGLEPVAMVDAPGQFSRRGGIVDVFPLLGDEPYRLEFFGDEVDTIRPFNPETQASGPALESPVTLVDVSRDAFRAVNETKTGLLDYLPPDTIIVVWHPERVARVAGLYSGGFADADALIPFESVAGRFARYPLSLCPDLDDDAWPGFPWPPSGRGREIDLRASGWERLAGGFDTAANELSILAAKNVRLTIACNNEGEEKRLRKVLAEKSPALLRSADILCGHLSRGFVRQWDGGGEAWVSDHELFGRASPVRAARKRYAGTPIADFAELREGDYVVHVANGIARYEGMATLDHDGTGAEQDFLVLRFAEDARIYVPLSHIELVQRYIGLGESKPQLSKLGSAAWTKKKEAAEAAVRDIAQDLLATQAKRLSSSGVALPPDDVLVEEFDASFPYDETPDQLAAIDDIRRDQQSSAPMERLLCGDVGFGKTEMAVRAAFRAVNAGKQAAILVPTTILAEQHYRTFSNRMADYPVRVESLSRFRGPNEQKRIVEDVRDGRVDVVIGTHRLLSRDVKFRDLGLVVIDEEQKFGVEAKEKLKRFRADVDILTMTATPIPRTLHMSLLGLRDISNLTTAPRERHSVKTMVVRWSKEVVRRAILRELSRGGQCFFLHNRVRNIDAMAAELREIAPEARIGVGHGQMAEGELLGIMQRFLDGKLDVLVCTTIIESGVDIPNVNTLFVNQADHFGLSELHQLRGRVGRYKHQAYAYFLVPEKRPISPEATKRLQALQEYSELGSGFRIAMRDLEIRGAGNLLGVEQSGHIHMIGFDLYCRLLERAVAAQKGETVADDVEVELDLGTRAFIPPEYIPSEQERIEFYRRLTRIRDKVDLDATRRYIRDRYGKPPAPVERCFQDQALRIRMVDVGMSVLGRVDGGALAATFLDHAVKRGVMLMRHAGLKITTLRKNQWRIEVPVAEPGLDASEYAVNAANALLAILEKLGPLEAKKQPPVRIGRGKRWEEREAIPESDIDSVPLDMDISEEDELPEVPVPTPPPVSGPEEPAKPARRKKKTGKSGILASEEKEEIRALSRRESALPGGARTMAKMPASGGGTGIISLGGTGKNAPAAKPIPLKSAPKASLKPSPFKAKRLAKKEPKPPPEFPPPDLYGGVGVLGIEPYIADSAIGVVVPDTAFNPIRHEVMMLIIKGERKKKHLLRLVGMTACPGHRMVLRLSAASPAEAQETTEEYLAAGEASLYDGEIELPYLKAAQNAGADETPA